MAAKLSITTKIEVVLVQDRGQEHMSEENIARNATRNFESPRYGQEDEENLLVRSSTMI